MFFCSRTTVYGSLSVVGSHNRGVPRIIRVLVSDRRTTVEQKRQALFPASHAVKDQRIAAIAAQLVALLAGEDVRVSRALLRWNLCSPFQKRVLHVVSAIPRGRVSSYGSIARAAGRPQAARAVGTALATNPFPLIIPCHRVIRSDGSPGEYGPGAAMKQALLAREGVAFPLTKDRILL